jgi:hypothetical protein
LGRCRDGKESTKVTVEPDVLELSDDLRQLIEVGEERGALRQSDLNDVLEPLQLDPLETDAVYRELETRGIEVEAGPIVADAEVVPIQPAGLLPQWETTTDALQLFLRDAGRHQ